MATKDANKQDAIERTKYTKTINLNDTEGALGYLNKSTRVKAVHETNINAFVTKLHYYPIVYMDTIHEKHKINATIKLNA